MHWPDPGVPIEETAAAIADLQRTGKIRVIGVSNFSPTQTEAFRKIAPVQTVQSHYNLFERAIEEDVLRYCRDKNIAVLAYGSLCRGLLSGRVTAQTQFGGDDLRKVDPKFRAPRFEQYLRAVERLDRFAQANYGRRVIHLALRWILDRQDGTVALWGARHPDQLAPIAGLRGWRIDSSAMAEIDRILSETVVNAVGPEFMAPPFSARPESPKRESMEHDMLEYAALRTKDLRQEAPSANNVSEKAKAKAVRASYEFWSTGDESLLEQAFAQTFAEHFVRPRCEPAANGLRPSGAVGPGKRTRNDHPQDDVGEH